MLLFHHSSKNLDSPIGEFFIIFKKSVSIQLPALNVSTEIIVSAHENRQGLNVKKTNDCKEL